MTRPRLNTVLLQHISHEINSGNGLWGLLQANEYLSPRHPLRLALIKTLGASAQDMQHIPAVRKVFDGLRLGELEEAEQDILRTLSHSQLKANRIVPVMRSYQTRPNGRVHRRKQVDSGNRR